MTNKVSRALYHHNHAKLVSNFFIFFKLSYAKWGIFWSSHLRLATENSEIQPNKAINLKTKNKNKKIKPKPPIRSIFLATKQNQNLRYE